ncbi:MAG: hypothetical protein V4485_02300 [Pseudomonadota bacterium]
MTKVVEGILSHYDSDSLGTKAIRSGGGSGFIIGRNSFQRNHADACPY